MKTIAFYISNHGFGHASRNISIIERVLKLEPDLKVIIKTASKQLDFITQSLEEHSSRIECYESTVDVGLILKNNSLDVDRERLYEVLTEYIDSWNVKIQSEKNFLRDKNVDLVVSDIVPWIFKSCDIANITSVFISNFTWVEIYKNFFNENIWRLYLEAYKLADKALLYRLSADIKEYFNNVEEVGLCCRAFHETEVHKIRKQYGRPIVFVSVGRSVELENGISVEGLPYDFLYTEGIKLVGNNTHKLLVDTDNMQDYIKASDFVITKAGWSTVSEAICARKPMLVISRDELAEDKQTVEKLLELNVAIKISTDDLNRIKLISLLKELSNKEKEFSKLDDKYKDCSGAIAVKLLEML